MAQDSQSIDFLYDFLYLDTSRAHSWLCQMVAEGVQVSSKYNASSTSTNTLGATGGIPAVMSGSGTATNGATETHERQFSNEWSIPLTLIDMLDENGFITKGLADAPLGSLVHIWGKAQVMDIGFMQTVWDPMTRFLALQEKVTHANKGDMSKNKTFMGSLGEVLKSLPPFPQIYMQTKEGPVAWAVLKPEHMILDTSAIALSYGANIQGDWHMIAALDALPDSHHDFIDDGLSMGGDLAVSFLPFIHAMKAAVGRNANAYAVNPVAIFRAVPRSR